MLSFIKTTSLTDLDPTLQDLSAKEPLLQDLLPDVTDPSQRIDLQSDMTGVRDEGFVTTVTEEKVEMRYLQVQVGDAAGVEKGVEAEAGVDPEQEGEKKKAEVDHPLPSVGVVMVEVP